MVSESSTNRDSEFLQFFTDVENLRDLFRAYIAVAELPSTPRLSYRRGCVLQLTWQLRPGKMGASRYNRRSQHGRSETTRRQPE